MLIYCVSVTTITVVENCSILHTCIYNPCITYLYAAGDYIYLLNYLTYCRLEEVI